MPKYLVLLEGENFRLKSGNGTQLLGFYTTRKVNASNEEDAELKAVAAITSDSKLLSSIDNTIGPEPKIYMSSISQIGWWHLTGGTGYTFFPMEEE